MRRKRFSLRLMGAILYRNMSRLYTWSPQGLANQLAYVQEQTVVVDGVSSPPVHVSSSVPQGTVLGPLMFLLCINDIGPDCSSSIRLFADDTILYSIVERINK